MYTSDYINRCVGPTLDPENNVEGEKISKIGTIYPSNQSMTRHIFLHIVVFLKAIFERPLITRVHDAAYTANSLISARSGLQGTRRELAIALTRANFTPQISCRGVQLVCQACQSSAFGA